MTKEAYKSGAPPSTCPSHRWLGDLAQIVFDTMADGVMAEDTSGAVVAVNRPAIDMLGQGTILTGRAIAEVFGPDLIDDGGHALSVGDLPGAVARRTEESSAATIGVGRPEGTRLWLSVKARPVRDPETGAVVGAVSIMTDVTVVRAKEDLLAASEARFRDIFANAPIGKAIVSLEGVFLEVNNALCNMIGYRPEELVGRTFMEITSPDDIAIDLTGYHELLEKGIRVNQIEKRFRHRDGHDVWVQVTALAVMDQNGMPAYGIVQVQSLNEQKSAAASLSAMAQRLSLALGSGRLGVWDLDLRSNLVTWDERMFAIYGIEPCAAMPNGHWERRVVPDDLPRAKALTRDAIARKGRNSGEYRIHRPSGEVRYIQESQDVVLDGEGNVVRVVGVDCDITERRVAEQAVETARVHLRALIDALPLWVALIDRDGTLVVANKHYTKHSGLKIEEIEGRHYSEVMTRTQAELRRPFIERCMNGEEVTFTAADLQRDGAALQIHGRYVPLVENGRVSGMVAAVADITELKRAESELMRVNADLVKKVRQITHLQSELRELSVRDGLTGLFNRRFMDEQLPRELAKALREHQTVAIAMGDIDRFKNLNDTFGHMMGDQALRILGKLASSMVRQGDLVCRYGGEEILLIMPGATVEAAHLVVERLRKAFIAAPIVLQGEATYATISFGLAMAPAAGTNAAQLVAAADHALYEAKSRGRNQTVIFEGVAVGRLH